MRMLRLILQGVLIFFSLLLVFALVKSSGEITLAWVLLSLFFLAILLLGPLWPWSKKEKQRPTRPSTEILRNVGPISAYPAPLVIMAVVFFYFAWETYYYPRNSYREIFAVAYESYGNMGVVILNLFFGIALLLGAALVYQRLKSSYRRLD